MKKQFKGIAAHLERLLLSGESVSCLRINQALNTTNGLKYISILRLSGLPILCEWKRTNSGKRYKSYRLDPKYLLQNNFGK
jgi:hypothetical protein